MPQPKPNVTNMKVRTTMSPTTQQPDHTVEPGEGPLELEIGDEAEAGHESESKGGDSKNNIESDDQLP